MLPTQNRTAEIVRNTLVAGLISLATVVSSAADTKIAVIDNQRVLTESKAGKKATEEFKKEQDKKQKDIEKRGADLNKQREDLIKKQAVLSDEAKNKRGQEFQESVAQHQEYIQKARLELAKKENDLLAPIAEKMKKIIEKVAKEKGCSIVLQMNPAVAWTAEENDITSDVIAAFDKEK
jgi:outer membrane protein